MNIRKKCDEVDPPKKAKTAFFTGDNRINKSSIDYLAQKLARTIETLTKQGVIYYGCGSVEGFDWLAVSAVLSAQKNNPLIKLILVLPSQNQDNRWNGADKQTFRAALENADKVVYMSERYAYDCIQKRNLHLIKHSGVCVAYVKLAAGDTAKIVGLARENGLKIVNLAEGSY